MDGKEREAQGSKCIAGLQITSCARAVLISNDTSSSSSSSSSSNDSVGRSRGSYGCNNSDNSRRNSDGVGNNKMGGVGSRIINRERVSSGSIGSKEEHTLVFKRPHKNHEEDIVEKFACGDRVIISLEKENPPLRTCKTPITKQESTQNLLRSVDIEDLGSKNQNSRSISNFNATMESDVISATYLVEPHITTGQILKITVTEVHIRVRERPRRLLRYGQTSNFFLFCCCNSIF